MERNEIHIIDCKTKKTLVTIHVSDEEFDELESEGLVFWDGDDRYKMFSFPAQSAHLHER